MIPISNLTNIPCWSSGKYKLLKTENSWSIKICCSNIGITEVLSIDEIKIEDEFVQGIIQAFDCF